MSTLHDKIKIKNPSIHENITLPGEVDSILGADSKLNQLPPVRSGFHETLQGVSAGEYLQVYR